jgi:hypothetical protein
MEAAETYNEAADIGDGLLRDVLEAADIPASERLLAETVRTAVQDGELSAETRCAVGTLACNALANGIAGAPGLALAALTADALDHANSYEDAVHLGRLFAPALRAHNTHPNDRISLDLANDVATPDRDDEISCHVFTQTARRIAEGSNRAHTQPHAAILDYADGVGSSAPDLAARRAVNNAALTRLEQYAPCANARLLAETSQVAAYQNLLDESACGAQQVALDMLRNGAYGGTLEKVLSLYGQGAHARAADDEDRYNLDSAVMGAIERHTSDTPTQQLARDLQQAAADFNVSHRSGATLLLRGMQVTQQPLRGSGAENLALIGTELPLLVPNGLERYRVLSHMYNSMRRDASPELRAVISDHVQRASLAPLKLHHFFRWGAALFHVDLRSAGDVLQSGLHQVLDTMQT